jgi:hypothetical protein
MASTKLAPTTATKLPDGFVSPFTRVEMEPNVRIDDGLCCVAMLTNQPLEKIKKLAFEFGLAEHGPAWAYADLLRKLLLQFNLVAGEDKDAGVVAALPDVAMVMASFSTATLFGRWVLWHHVRATEKVPSHSYIIDPAYWLGPDRHITTDFKYLFPPKTPLWYMEITTKPAVKGKGK